MGVPSRVRLVLALAISFALTPTVQSAYASAAPQTVVSLVQPPSADASKRPARRSRVRIIGSLPGRRSMAPTASWMSVGEGALLGW